eukprot:2824699-Alexandrium_andersonii.AAC.1
MGCGPWRRGPRGPWGRVARPRGTLGPSAGPTLRQERLRGGGSCSEESSAAHAGGITHALRPRASTDAR